LERLGQKQIAIQRDFIADAAHELRTPLSVLRVRVDTMKDQEIAQYLRSDIGAMGRTVNQLLDIAQSETLVVGADEYADLQSVCSETVAHLAPLALAQQKDVALTGAEQAVWVRGNTEALLHAVRNLLENALAHTAVGTSAEIDVDASGVIRVSDCGPGVAMHERELVFRRFWRRDRRRTGSAGLGLSIVSKIVEAHGGTITVGDREGGGAVFTLALASALVPAAVAAAVGTAAEDPGTGDDVVKGNEGLAFASPHRREGLQPLCRECLEPLFNVGTQASHGPFSVDQCSAYCAANRQSSRCRLGIVD
jgi:signal transduction histidine kinase